jgi:acylphosphatase
MGLKVRAHVIVSGRVQGVYFRYATREEAAMRGVKGWARNLPDGRVEAVFEGEKEIVDQLIDFCRCGPPNAKISAVEVTWEEYTGEFKDFFIRYRGA